ncbi:MAG: putative thioesterase [Chloroflexi bacterium]|nr:MAG: putative thioesterase [Chloroflexota bacterium]
MKQLTAAEIDVAPEEPPFNSTKRPQIHSSWIRESSQRLEPHLRLFCFPYAGGGVSIFRTWAEDLPAGIQLCPIQLPGREDRLAEKPYDRLQALIPALADHLHPYLNDFPFAFFGHSMGALVSFELARELRRRNSMGPLRLYVSGYRAPQLPDPDPAIHDLPDGEFLSELRRLEGTPDEVLENEELTRLLLPALRADFAVCETYTHIYQRPLSCPIMAFGGIEDREIRREELEAWREQTEDTFHLRMLPGNHFFIHSAREQLLEMLAVDLS